ncbi:hypothetical protein Tco_1526062 [Tanacetum coccineum]
MLEGLSSNSMGKRIMRFFYQNLQFCWSQTSHTNSSDEILKPFFGKGLVNMSALVDTEYDMLATGCCTGLHEIAMITPRFSLLLMTIAAQSCFFDTPSLTNLSPRKLYCRESVLLDILHKKSYSFTMSAYTRCQYMCDPDLLDSLFGLTGSPLKVKIVEMCVSCGTESSVEKRRLVDSRSTINEKFIVPKDQKKDLTPVVDGSAVSAVTCTTKDVKMFNVFPLEGFLSLMDVLAVFHELGDELICLSIACGCDCLAQKDKGSLEAEALFELLNRECGFWSFDNAILFRVLHFRNHFIFSVPRMASFFDFCVWGLEDEDALMPCLSTYASPVYNQLQAVYNLERCVVLDRSENNDEREWGIRAFEQDTDDIGVHVHKCQICSSLEREIQEGQVHDGDQTTASIRIEPPRSIDQSGIGHVSFRESMNSSGLTNYKSAESFDKPFGKTVIKLMVMEKNKKDEDQTVISNKARLVAKGLLRNEGIDFNIRVILMYSNEDGILLSQHQNELLGSSVLLMVGLAEIVYESTCVTGKETGCCDSNDVPGNEIKQAWLNLYICVRRSYALSWKPCQGDSLNLPNHRYNIYTIKRSYGTRGYIKMEIGDAHSSWVNYYHMAHATNYKGTS